MEDKANYIHIFAGCGGLSLGLYKSGWKGIFAIEKSEMAFETLKYNLIQKVNHFDWPDWLPINNHDINDVLKFHKKNLKNLSGKISLIAGGPPCQGFSSAGKRIENDERNKLIDSYIEFVKIIKPEIIFFENVSGFKSQFKKKRFSSGKKYSEYVKKKLEILKYNVKADIINFADYGIPQKRKRFILVGMRKNNPEEFFLNLEKLKNDFLSDRNLKENVTVKEAISDLERKHGEIKSFENEPFNYGVYGEVQSNYQEYLRKDCLKQIADSHRFTNHSNDIIERFNYFQNNLPKNKNIGKIVSKIFNKKKYYQFILDENEQSPTLTTLPDDIIHYNEPRILTVREYARIQSFDDWFEFKNKYTTGGPPRRYEVPRYTQVGNAIPPLFMEYCGTILRKYC